MGLTGSGRAIWISPLPPNFSNSVPEQSTNSYIFNIFVVETPWSLLGINLSWNSLNFAFTRNTFLQNSCFSWRPCPGVRVLVTTSPWWHPGGHVLASTFWVHVLVTTSPWWHPGGHVLVAMSWRLRPGCMFWWPLLRGDILVAMSYSGRVLASTSWGPCSGDHFLGGDILAAMSWSPCSGNHVLGVTSWWPCTGGHVLVAISRWSHPGRPVLVTMSWWPRPGRHILEARSRLSCPSGHTLVAFSVCRASTILFSRACWSWATYYLQYSLPCGSWWTDADPALQ